MSFLQIQGYWAFFPLRNSIAMGPFLTTYMPQKWLKNGWLFRFMFEGINFYSRGRGWDRENCLGENRSVVYRDTCSSVSSFEMVSEIIRSLLFRAVFNTVFAIKIIFCWISSKSSFFGKVMEGCNLLSVILNWFGESKLLHLAKTELWALSV